MDERENILSDLVHLRRSLADIRRELSRYPWDFEKPMVIISKQDFLNVLKKCSDGLISFEDLENWADAIELRDDIGFETDEMLEIIFELANPDINGQLSKERLEEMIKELS
jgi:hypothetical protein